MIKKILLCWVFLYYSVLVSAQINLDIRGKKIDYFRQIEKENKSEQFQSNTDYINGNDVGQPLIYKRRQENLPDLLVYYFPFKKDSTIYEVLYEWSDANFSKNVLPKPVEDLKPYISKYKELLDQITLTFGKGQATGNLDDLSLIQKGEFKRNDEWNLENFKILSYITLSSKQFSSGFISIKPTYTIRLYLKNTTENASQNGLSKDAENLLDSKVTLFLTEICAGQFDNARKYFSAKVNESVKNEQLDALKEVVKNNKWIFDGSGKQLLLPSAKLYNYLRYKKEGDSSKPPIEILSVLFDDDNKIIAIQPLNRRGDRQ